MTSQFPAIAPLHAIEKRTSSLSINQRTADGFRRLSKLGLNPTRPSWRVHWEVEAVQVNEIETFLSSRAADGEPFHWDSPDPASSTNLYKCKEWNRTRLTGFMYAIDAEFEQVFEPDNYILLSAANPYNDDTLCESDFEAYKSAYLWISYQDQVCANSLSRNSPTLTDRFACSYQIVQWPKTASLNVLAIIKRKSTGEVVWQKTYGDGIAEFNAQTVAAKQMPDDTLVVLVQQGDNNYYNRPAFLINIDKEGNVLWSKKFAPNQTGCSFESITINPADYTIGIGGVDQGGGSYTFQRAITVFFDKFGNLIEGRKYMIPNEFSSNQRFNTPYLQADQQGNWYVIMSYRPSTFDQESAARNNVLIHKLNQNRTPISAVIRYGNTQSIASGLQDGAAYTWAFHSGKSNKLFIGVSRTSPLPEQAGNAVLQVNASTLGLELTRQWPQHDQASYGKWGDLFGGNITIRTNGDIDFAGAAKIIPGKFPGELWDNNSSAFATSAIWRFNSDLTQLKLLKTVGAGSGTGYSDNSHNSSASMAKYDAAVTSGRVFSRYFMIGFKPFTSYTSLPGWELKAYKSAQAENVPVLPNWLPFETVTLQGPPVEETDFSYVGLPFSTSEALIQPAALQNITWRLVQSPEVYPL